MVKKLDEMDARDTASIDHIGWRFWSTTQAWKERYTAGMLAAGHQWYAEARSSIMPFLDRTGTRQVELVRRMGLSKQAVQQLIDDLERDGIVERQPDPSDRRGKIVMLTQRGLDAQADANRVKRQIEADIRARLGDQDFQTLERLLKRLETL